MANRKIEHIRLSNSDELFDVQDILLADVNEEITALRSELATLTAEYKALKDKVDSIEYNGGEPNPNTDSGLNTDSGITGTGGTGTNFTGQQG